MYFLSVGAVFRNESNSIVEWVKHYLYHGVDHFYLINDNSSDDTVSKIQGFIDMGLITLYHSKEEYYLGRQRSVYNHFILPHVKQKDTQWLLMIDLDEYVWSPISICIGDVLRMGCSQLGQIQIQQYVYGSNGHVTQPESIVKHFTKRSHELVQCYKYFVNSNFEFSSLNIHHADFANEAYKTDASIFMIVDPCYFILNHYSCQSLDFWQHTKRVRGDGDGYKPRDMGCFRILDRNDLEDLQLCEQNKDII
jgi:hypothetical protein